MLRPAASTVPVHALLSRIEATDWTLGEGRDHLLPGATRIAILVGSAAALWIVIGLAVAALL